jgi:hypothetical protein
MLLWRRQFEVVRVYNIKLNISRCLHILVGIGTHFYRLPGVFKKKYNFEKIPYPVSVKCKNKKSILPPLISRRMLIFHTQRCVCLPLGSLNIDFVVSVHCVYFIILSAVHFSLALVFHLMPRRKSMLTRKCSLHRSLSKYMLFNYRDL